MMIKKILNHLRQGTFMKAAREKIRHELGFREQGEISRWGADSEEKAIEFLAKRAEEVSVKRNRNHIIVVTINKGIPAGDTFKSENPQRRITTVSLDTLTDILQLPAAEISCVVSACFDARSTMKIGRFLMSHDTVREIPFEYILLPGLDSARVRKVDRYSDYSFTSPLFAASIDYIGIYEESLTRFEQKCDIRDYMDLCQLLDHVVKNEIPGGIAEFGSFRGHSGYLITQTLKKLGAEKEIKLFDMFQEFPAEALGVDYFWDEHRVNFEEVKGKFSEFENVELVKGDFTETILRYPDIKLSFIFVDCDSYRATKFLVNHLFDKHLSAGGLLVFEDYGHPALLGNRLAVHECFDHRKDCFTYYSQFSGFYIVAKNFQR